MRPRLERRARQVAGKDVVSGVAAVVVGVSPPLPKGIAIVGRSGGIVDRLSDRELAQLPGCLAIRQGGQGLPTAQRRPPEARAQAQQIPAHAGRKGPHEGGDDRQQDNRVPDVPAPLARHSLSLLRRRPRNEGTPTVRGALIMHRPTGICVPAASACG